MFICNLHRSVFTILTPAVASHFTLDMSKVCACHSYTHTPHGPYVPQYPTHPAHEDLVLVHTWDYSAGDNIQCV